VKSERVYVSCSQHDRYRHHSFLISGSGGNFALAAARALLPVSGQSAREIVQRSLEIAADICVFTNRSITVLEVPQQQQAVGRYFTLPTA
jgi:ATP-dependent protease HslVU (ClpYQ) peptidase subunit